MISYNSAVFGSKRIAQRAVESAVSAEFIERARCSCAQQRMLQQTSVACSFCCAVLRNHNAGACERLSRSLTQMTAARARCVRRFRDANDGDTITFAVTGTIVLTSGGLAINKNVTISGPGPDQLSIDGNQAKFQCVFGSLSIIPLIPPRFPD